MLTQQPQKLKEYAEGAAEYDSGAPNYCGHWQWVDQNLLMTYCPCTLLQPQIPAQH